MTSLAAVAVEGAKGVGKTATSSLRAADVFRLDDDAVRQVVAADPAVLDRPGTVVIDEWQRHPPVWDYVRRRVDDGAPPGSFLLTGSAVPADAPAHSGAGRIVQLRMRPLSLAERDLGPWTVSLGQLLRGEHPGIAGRSTTSLAGYVDEIVVSGFPGIRPLDPRARRAQLDGYVQRVVQRDFPEQGLRVRRPDALRGWLTAYAAATATTASYNSILDAATAGEGNKPTKTTVIAYRDVLSQLWLVEPLPGWTPGRPDADIHTGSPKPRSTISLTPVSLPTWSVSMLALCSPERARPSPCPVTARSWVPSSSPWSPSASASTRKTTRPPSITCGPETAARKST